MGTKYCELVKALQESGIAFAVTGKSPFYLRVSVGSPSGEGPFAEAPIKTLNEAGAWIQERAVALWPRSSFAFTYRGGDGNRELRVEQRFPVTGTYRHLKSGRHYRVIGKAQHHETLDPLVVYQGERDKRVWVRELDDFLATVILDGLRVPRFVRIP